MRIHRAWLVAGVTMLTLIAASAFRSTTSVLYMPIEMEFGWTRSLTSSAVALNILVYGLTAPFAAVFMARFGVKRVALSALGLIAAGTLLTTVMHQAWELYADWGILVGIGTGCIALVFGAQVASNWFVKRRGLVTGIFSASYATGQLLFLPAITQIANDQGWRTATAIVAAFCLGLIPVFALVFKDAPSQGQAPYGGTTQDIPAKPPVTVKANVEAMKYAISRPAFWALALTFFVCGWSTNGLIAAHFIPAAHDHGMPTTLAAGLLATVGIFDFIGTIASGWLTDRFDPAWLLVVYYGLRGLALFTFPFVIGPTVEPPMIFFIVFYGLDWIATVPPTVELCRRHFGVANSGLIYGWVFASHMVGAAIASAFAGWIRQFQGDYFIAWIVAGVLCLGAAAYSTSLRKPVLNSTSSLNR
ncbi:MAG: MFS transporter [Actinomycetales bacterium]|nr:MFS transporter [Actinomycetales bacterium]